VLVPLSAGVENITPVMEDREVELVISHAKHFLRATIPIFQSYSAFESARANKTLVAVTETQEDDIIDVRPLSETSDTATFRAPPERGPGTLGTAVSVTLAQEQQMFDLVSPKICCPATAAPCITFNYADDGCWAPCA
jgi:hypothetical protein